MTNSLIKIVSVLLWFVTFPFVAPARIEPPKGFTLFWAIPIIATFPNSRETSPFLYFMAEYGYWIGIVLLFATSWLVIRTRDKNARTVKIVVGVDLGIIGLSILTSIVWFTV